jgi:SAM-dependent methyltransferase
MFMGPMTAPDHALFDVSFQLAARERAAAQAHEHDFLLRRVADDFADRLSFIRRDFPLAASLGAYHGVLSRHLRAACPNIGLIIDVERSPRLLARCDGPAVLAEDDLLPFKTASLDLVVSGLSLHRVNDLPGTLVQIQRALKPDGLFLAALLGGATLTELRDALVAAESEVTGGASPRVAPFADVRDCGALLQRAGFALPVADSDIVSVGYATALDLMQDLRAMGAANALLDRSRRFLSRRVLMRAAEIYAERHARPDGRVSATFEIITLTAWAPAAGQQQPLRPGSARTRLADALGAREISAGDAAGTAPREK